MQVSKFLMMLVLMLVLAGSKAAGELAASPVPAKRSNWPTLQPARIVSHASQAPLLAAARAGQRIVAVGDHGVILLSDDGVRFRQAKLVPVRVMLTSVQFLDERVGYAAGHDGVVLATRDGGETWALRHALPGQEQPILALHFDTLSHGIAVGLYGWVLETQDGGSSWTQGHIGEGDNTDHHLYHVFSSAQGTLFIAAEAGVIYRSSDHGKTWAAQQMGSQGSLWHGAAMADGTLLVCGMRGHLYRSRDDGHHWEEVATGTTESLTGIAAYANNAVTVVGMAGTVLQSTDAGQTFRLRQRPEREPLTAAIDDGKQHLVLLSLAGQIAP
ncbi:glycosyl hydrolase [Pseudoduganella sp. FT93W]|uniref:Glycosyl hydrolase n=1 Tax=Duganella fentianensis TaxID=2692177 RepID=A0A845HZ64_9BURK|nr:YCF48-related protein [Duganella fentianensis]MYN44771.1 glycosyl hydrolase [Duganella fentianensis]